MEPIDTPFEQVGYLLGSAGFAYGMGSWWYHSWKKRRRLNDFRSMPLAERFDTLLLMLNDQRYQGQAEQVALSGKHVKLYAPDGSGYVLRYEGSRLRVDYHPNLMRRPVYTEHFAFDEHTGAHQQLELARFLSAIGKQRVSSLYDLERLLDRFLGKR